MVGYISKSDLYIIIIVFRLYVKGLGGRVFSASIFRS